MRLTSRHDLALWPSVLILLGTTLAGPIAPAQSTGTAVAQAAGNSVPSASHESNSPSAGPGGQAAEAARDTANAAQSSSQPTGQEASGNDQGMFVFKKQVEEVVLHATVVDDQQRLVTSLHEGDFSVSVNGVPQTITSFRREDVPVELGIVVDNSGSMRDKRERVSAAVLSLVTASNPQDRIFVVNFGQHPYLDQDFTSNVNLLRAALHRVTARGSTAVYDAIWASEVHLEHNPLLGKKALLVITDGEDNMSQETLPETLRRLQQPDGPTLYAIGLEDGGLRADGREALRQLASETGGVAYFPNSMDQVQTITQTLAHDIRSQYIIAFRPKNQNVKPDYQNLQVAAHAPGYARLTVRTRSGYYSENKLGR
jgi:VWFA-related protein